MNAGVIKIKIIGFGEVWPQRSLKVAWGIFYVYKFTFSLIFLVCLNSNNIKAIIYLKSVTSKVIKGHLYYVCRGF